MVAPGLFIVGCPRSGTTLVSALLERRLGVAVPVETQFLPTFRRWRWLWGDLGDCDNRRRLLSAIFDFVAIWTPRAIAGRVPEEVLPHTILAARPDAEGIAVRSHDFASLVEELFRAFARSHGREHWGEKSAFFEPLSPAVLADSCPGTRFLHLIRDGRDVAASWTPFWFGPNSVAAAAVLWRQHVACRRAWGRRHPERYLEIRYEDLTAHPQETLERISAFLGIGLSADDLGDSGFARALSRGDTHTLLAGAVRSDNSGKWRQRFSEADTVAFDWLAGRTLECCGYIREAPSATILRRLAAALSAVLRLSIEPLRPLHAVRSLKILLPLVLFAAQRLGLDLTRCLSGNGDTRS